MFFSFTTAVVPKKNAHRAGISKYGRLYQYRDKKAVTSESSLKSEAIYQANQMDWKKLEGPVKVTAKFRKTRGDCIGLLETVLDALEGVAYENDRQVWQIEAYWSDLLPKAITCEIDVKNI